MEQYNCTQMLHYPIKIRKKKNIKERKNIFFAGFFRVILGMLMFRLQFTSSERGA